MPRRPDSRLRLNWAILLLGWAMSATVPAGAQPASAEAVKAAFVLNFTKFVEWPDSAFESRGSPLVLCVAGVDASLHDALSELDGRAVQGRTLTVRRAQRPSAAEGCHAAYLSDLAAADAGAGMLTIGDAPEFAARGGMIGLFDEGGKVRFEINLQSVQRSQLRFSAQLMKLARIAGERR